MAKKKEKQMKAAYYAGIRAKKRNRRKKRIIIVVLEVMVLALLSCVAYVMAKYDRFQTVSIDDDDIDVNDGIKQEGYTTIALFGGDSRDGQLEEGTHADTIIIASIDHESKEIRMASVYRDTFLQQADGSYLKANNAYFSGGPKEAINMLNKNLDLDIEDYVTVDFKALVDTIDLLGGLEIEIKEEEVQYVNEYLQETADVAGTQANFISQAGEQHLDGAQAVTYARIRSTEGGDYTRTERQRLVIQKMFEKGIKTDLVTINNIIDTVFPQVSTSFTLSELVSLASGVTKYNLGENTGFPIDKTDDTRADVGSIVIPVDLESNVQKLHEFLYPKEEGYTMSDTVKKISQEISYITGVVKTDDSGAQTGTDNVTGDEGTAGAGSVNGEEGTAGSGGAGYYPGDNYGDTGTYNGDYYNGEDYNNYGDYGAGDYNGDAGYGDNSGYGGDAGYDYNDYNQ